MGQSAAGWRTHGSQEVSWRGERLLAPRAAGPWWALGLVCLQQEEQAGPRVAAKETSDVIWLLGGFWMQVLEVRAVSHSLASISR